MKNICIRLTSLALTLAIAITCISFSPLKAEAATEKTAIGLAEHGLKAYRDGWLYNYGSYGEISGGNRRSDCSGLIYSYLCWSNNNSSPVHNWNMPRTVMAQVNSSSKKGPISTLPRTHGLLLTIANYDHIGIYLGNNKSADNSDYGVNMRYLNVSSYEWTQWHKLDSVKYPTNGWYKFDGSPFYYQNGQYVVNTTKTIDGKKYTFNSAGKPNPLPKGYTEGSGGSDDKEEDSGTSVPDKVKIAAKTTADGGLNLRKGAGTNYGVIATLAKGTAVTITNKDNSNWYKIKTSSNLVGFASSDYIQTTGSTTTKPEPKPVVSIKAKTTENVNLRKSTSTSSSVIVLVPKNTTLTITEKTNSSWYKVKTAGGKVGYIYASYLKAVPTSGSTTVSIKAYTTDIVNLRKGKGSSYAVVKVVPNKTALTITDKSDKNWYKVKLSNGTVGYMSSAYIKEGTLSSGSTATNIKAYSTADALNIRKGAGAGYSVVKVIPKNTNLTITSKANKSWYKVKLSNGTVGYASSQYLKAGTAPTASTSTAVSIKATTTATVNLRKGAGSGYSVIVSLKSGTAITITNKTNKDWYKIKTAGGKVGYVASKYLKVTSSAEKTKVMTTTAGVNLRKSASSTATVLTIVPEGTKVTVTSTANKSWYKVKLSSGKVGYISSTYLK